jgi:dihydrofolate synthase/folylpolyglutamate synthase
LPGLGTHAPTVIVGGTNGKGTTSGYLAQLLTAAGLKTGLFTSPHLEHFSERFWLSDRTLDDSDLVAALARLRQQLPPSLYEELSFFEVNTLLAMQVFADAGTDLNVLEVGLGGRWDSTNAFEPVLSVITSIGMDHMEFLGDTVAKIAGEKAGIMRRDRICIWSGVSNREADQVIRAEADRRGALLHCDGEQFGLGPDGSFFATAAEGPIDLALPAEFRRLPDYLQTNFVSALAACSRLLQPEQLAGGITAVLNGGVGRPASLRGRFQMVGLAEPFGTFRHLLLDACHNPHGAAAFAASLRASLREGGREKLPAVISILKDKDHGAILDILRQVCSPVVLFSNRSERSWSATDVAPRHRDLMFCDDFPSAVRQAGEATADQTLVVCGSVHLIGEVLSFLRRTQPQP